MGQPEECPHCRCRQFYKDGKDLVCWSCNYRIVVDTREPRPLRGREKDREKARELARRLGLRVYW